MKPANIAELQALLEGIPLPAGRPSIHRYALHEGASREQIALLRQLPDRRYDTIDEVGEELLPVQPPSKHEVPHSPREESGAPPGADAYTQPNSGSGQVRDLDAASGG